MEKADHNRELSKIFVEMAMAYRYLGPGERFRAIAYRNAAKILSGLQEDVSIHIANNTLEELPGIGESISEKIREFVKTGRIMKYEQLKKKVPLGLIQMLDVRGFGPESLRKIHDQLHIETKDELVSALQDGRISALKGFGEKKTGNMLRSLKLHKTMEKRLLLQDALEAGEKVVEWIRGIPGVIEAELAGSLRRKKETIGDIDILVSCQESDRKKIVRTFTGSKFIKRVLAAGDTKASVILEGTGKQVDVRLVKKDEWGSALQYFTGSSEHNIHLRKIAKEKGYKISEYGIFRINSGKRAGGNTEEELYKVLGMSCMPPEMREDRGEIELAQKKKLPHLLSLSDIRGDMQMHTTWSDGANTIEEMAVFAKEKPGYDYIVITDHSKSSRIANGMDEKQILKQIKAIETVNRKLGDGFIKCGIEVDILANGQLDIADEILSQLEWVTATIHSGFSKDNTQRLLRACENPFVNCIGHPSGRLIGEREAYAFDLDALLEVAGETGTALEINAQPERMDLDDLSAARAREMKIPLVISTDSHTISQLGYMRAGVSIARRAWCTADDILNTRPWRELKKFREIKLKKHHQFV